MQSPTPRIYYSLDLLLPFPAVRFCFSFRSSLSLGKVRLSEGTGVYIDGGRFYRRLKDGAWEDLTDKLVERRQPMP